ncbi:MAG: type II secretion system protein GspM [Alphaproteobacteria bacterium]
MTALSPLVSRSLAVAILVAALAALWVLLVAPVTEKFEGYGRSISHSRELLVRHLQIAAQRARLETELEELRRAQSSTGRFLEGGGIELVAAEAQNKVKNLIDANGATLKSTQILPAQEKDNFRKLTIRVTLSADTEALQKIFHALETANPYLFLDNIDIRSRRRRARRGRSVSQGELQIRFDLYGYMRIEGS